MVGLLSMKKNIIFLILFSIVVHVYFIAKYPLIVDELNIWNSFVSKGGFFEYWKHFIKYDTHQPLFYLFWYSIFKSGFSEFGLRLPSLFFFFSSAYYWEKLFPWTKNESLVPWGMFLFSPFVLMYSSFFLPYSLLIFASIFNFYALVNLEKESTRKSQIIFFISCLFLIFTHYYGALQALLTASYLVYCQKSWRLKFVFAFSTLVLGLILMLGSDFLNDFNAIHNYRKVPTLFNVVGAVNLLLGGRYLSILLLILILYKRKWMLFKSREFLFILTVIAIAYGKSKWISPSFEARYLLILIYPLYFLLKGLEIRFISLIITMVSLFSLYQLQGTFGASFVTKYEKVPRTNEGVGLFITPCPKFYFPSSNYLCKDYYQNYEQMTAGANQFIVHKDHYFFFKRLVRNSECERMQEPGLYSCRLQVK
ncbi:hypothetical protein DOM21_01290 [Bacteriovorax stolpii]|uniref:Uncharacterized protein n=2 Tax=Bacteriovorax stolpii TaxID=960 RepID=A0A2K9NYX8_BACTC|nr:hypothetical protein [Bacteriovorax stolpii]AUN99894.1 hypothetical protein C0V70_17640 [Bacteriovorax stolpii]QDK40113.1 hypothetical protein DOM21_01290 [Bacteriovorax stolpii]TDP54213.1 hypothetical protein C8D79_1506 [Bacteriovorax stolpii]